MNRPIFKYLAPSLRSNAPMTSQIARNTSRTMPPSHRSAFLPVTPLTTAAAPRAPPDGRLPLPRRGPGGGVATRGARRSERPIENCLARAPRPGNVGVAGRASDRPDDWGDTTMAPPRRPEIVIGLDVGKSSHWAHDDETPRQARRHRRRPIRPLRSKPIYTKRLNRGDHPA